ncbi:MAG: F-type H+-transporting ATPase subunit epsilon [Parcubacteria group bacterium Athens0714_25]|nr:MAG: F-type H+-transporting ATPase subunit epsilon [Parcubacteria group bacterium Athens0714_25]
MSEKKIKLKIVTPEKTVYEGEIGQITLPVSDGEVTILPNHRSYIASLKAGEIYLKTEKDDLYIAVSGGFIEFDQNNLVVLADTAERAEEIDIKRAEQARKRAEELKKERIEMDDGEYARVAAAIEKELARIKVGRKNRTRHSMTLD